MKIDRYEKVMAIKARLLDNVRDKVLHDLPIPTKLRESILGGVASEPDIAFKKIEKLIDQLFDTETARRKAWLEHIDAKIQAVVKEAQAEIDQMP